MASFFEKEAILDYTNILSEINSYETDSLEKILGKECAGDCFKAYAIYVNRVAFGTFRNDTLVLAEGASEERYLLELRLFNAEKEVYIRKAADGYVVRVICDNIGDTVDVVDSSSNFMGKATANDVGEGMVELYEPGRKIRMVIPAEAVAKQYALTTRSYITYDEDTCQAGFGYYRFLDICVAGKE